MQWEWVAVAIALNLLSVVARALAWTTVIRQAMPPPHPGVSLVFSAFSVGLFANAVLPGRIGELARVAVLTRKMPERKGAWALLVGTVFAHRVFDIVPVVLLVMYVALTANIPPSAKATLLFVIGVGVGLFIFAFVSARRQHHEMTVEGLGPVRRLWTMGRARPRRDALAVRRGRSPSSSRRSAGSARSSRSGRRCARSTSTRRCRPPASCCC